MHGSNLKLIQVQMLCTLSEREWFVAGFFAAHLRQI